MSENLKVLRGTEQTKAEDFVLRTQEVASEAGFGHVSKIWYGKTSSYEDGLAQLEAGKAITEDIEATIAEFRPDTERGQFIMRHKDGRAFVPTEHAVSQMGNWAKTGTWYVGSLLANPVDAKERELFKRDSGDADTLKVVLANGFRRVDPTKKFLWRTRKDGTLRAMLTDRYAVVDNRWFVEKLKAFIPGGRLSHWRGDSDTLYGNVLIPDTIREEKDSDYGGMVSVGNSEIGERRVSSMPSIFRAICMNGCIWGQTKGQSIKQVHRGKIDLDRLALEIQLNLQKQIPLLPQGIEKFLGQRSMGWDGAKMSAPPVLAQLVNDYSFDKKIAGTIFDAWHEERKATPDYAYTLFGVTNAVTRAAQKLSNAQWVHLDTVGGELAQFDRANFDRLIARAASLTAKEVEEVFPALAV